MDMVMGREVGGWALGLVGLAWLVGWWFIVECKHDIIVFDG